MTREERRPRRRNGPEGGPARQEAAHKAFRGLPRPKDRQEERPHPLRRRKGWGDGEVAGWSAGRAASGLEAGESVLPGPLRSANEQTAEPRMRIRTFGEVSLPPTRSMNQTVVCLAVSCQKARAEACGYRIPVLDLLEQGQARYARDTAAGRVDKGVSGCRRRFSLWVVKEGPETYQ